MPSVSSMQSQDDCACHQKGTAGLTAASCKELNKMGSNVPTFQPDLQIRPIQVHTQDLSIGDICAIGKDDAAGAWNSNVEGGPQVEVQLQQSRYSCQAKMRHAAGLPDACCRQKVTEGDAQQRMLFWPQEELSASQQLGDATVQQSQVLSPAIGHKQR